MDDMGCPLIVPKDNIDIWSLLEKLVREFKSCILASGFYVDPSTSLDSAQKVYLNFHKMDQRILGITFCMP